MFLYINIMFLTPNRLFRAEFKHILGKLFLNKLILYYVDFHLSQTVLTMVAFTPIMYNEVIHFEAC